jgi:hypothetical protein
MTILTRLAALGGALALAAGLPALGAAQAAAHRAARPLEMASRPGRLMDGNAFPSSVKGLQAAGARAVLLTGATEGYLYGVNVRSPASGWAVGFSCAPNCERGPENTLTEHWNGTTWARIPSPDLSPLEALVSVSAVSATDAWAVGTYVADPGDFRTLILHWNGTTWSTVPSPDPSPDHSSGLNILNGVTATSAGSAWAAGYFCVKRCQQDGEIDRTLILHWNGTTWSTVPSPSPGAGYTSLSSVSAVSAVHAWAVGTYTGKSGDDTLILYWNGTRWSRAASPDPHPGGGELTAVSAVSARNAWAAGYFCPAHCTSNVPPERTLILHWNGTRWSTAASPDPGHGGNDLTATSAASPARAWAVGYTCSQACGNTGADHPLILRWNGTRWSAR